MLLEIRTGHARSRNFKRLDVDDFMKSKCERGNERALGVVRISERIKQGDFSMNRFKMTAALLGLLTPCVAPTLRADDWNKETRLTTNQPLQVQDTVLAPGQY